MRYARFCTYVVVLLFLQFALAACVINGSVHVPDGSSTSDAGTINGDVYVGINATAHTAKQPMARSISQRARMSVMRMLSTEESSLASMPVPGI